MGATRALPLGASDPGYRYYWLELMIEGLMEDGNGVRFAPGTQKASAVKVAENSIRQQGVRVNASPSLTWCSEIDAYWAASNHGWNPDRVFLQSYTVSELRS